MSESLKTKAKNSIQASPKSKRRPAPARASSLDRVHFCGALLLLAGLVLAAYSNSFRADWHFDDRSNILENPYFWNVSLRPASLFRAMVQDFNQNRPFSNLTLALNYYFNGDRVWGYHLVNLVLHLLATWAAFWVLRLTFRQAGLPPARGDLAALGTAALWSIHPIQTQAVTYVVQRQTVMASALILCTLAAYIAGRRADQPARKLPFYLLAAGCLLVAMGSKEIALITPGLILLYEFYFFQKFSLAFLHRRRLALATGAVLLAAALAFSLRSGVWSILMTGYHRYNFTLTQRLLTEPRILFQYLGLILWPRLSRLALEHDPLLSTSLVHPGTTLPAILAWLVVLAAAIRYARRYPLLSFAGLWYLGNLFLESSFVPLDLMFEHRLYLPSLAVIALLVAAPIFAATRLRGVLVCLAAVAALLTVGTVSRNRVWRTEMSLWRDCVRKAPLKARSYLGLGKAFWQQGEPDRAIAVYSRALALNPDYTEAYYDRACVYAQQRQYDQALADYSRSLDLNPDQAQALNTRGAIYKMRGEYDLALRDFNRALDLAPNFAYAYFNRGVTYELRGQFDQALADLSRTLDLNPNYAEAYEQRGKVYAQQGYPDRAESDFAKARKLSPGLSAPP